MNIFSDEKTKNQTECLFIILYKYIRRDNRPTYSCMKNFPLRFSDFAHSVAVPIGTLIDFFWYIIYLPV